MRELDFARVDFYERTGLYRTIRSKGGSIVQGAATIRYRRFIKPFRTFHITTKIIYWDEQSIFMEHRFIGRDDFIHAIAICRQRLINCSAEHVMEILLASSTANTSMEKLENGDLVKMKQEMPLEVVFLRMKFKNKINVKFNSRCKNGLNPMKYQALIYEGLKVFIKKLLIQQSIFFTLIEVLKFKEKGSQLLHDAKSVENHADDE